MKHLGASVLMFAMLAAAAAGAAEPGFLGTWRFDAAASRYGKEPVPHAIVVMIEPSPQGIHYHSQTTLASGDTLTADYTADLEGHLAMVTGARGFLAPVSLRRIDESTLQADFQRGLRVIASSRSVVSADGGTLTVTTTSTASDGTPSVHVGIYHRVKAGQSAQVAAPDSAASSAR